MNVTSFFGCTTVCLGRLLYNCWARWAEYEQEETFIQSSPSVCKLPSEVAPFLAYLVQRGRKSGAATLPEQNRAEIAGLMAKLRRGKLG